MSDKDHNKNVDAVVAGYLAEENTAKDYGLVGSFFEENFSFIKKIAMSSEPILITGDTGTGKDVLANAIHFLSSRSDNEFNVVNLFATTDSLLESELFGHEKGAFTGAVKKRPGIVRASEKGTLFLDEIADIPFGFQAKILRLVENNEIQPIGSDKTENVDVRIIAATNQDLEGLVSKRMFREDLFFRLNIFNFRIPPLKSREYDVYDLILHFIDEYIGNNVNAIKPSGKELSDAFKKFSLLPLKGNVRELRAYVIRWLTFQGVKTIDQIIEEANGFQQSKPPEENEIAEADFEESSKIKPSEHFKNLDSIKLEIDSLNKDIKELEEKMINLAVEETKLANGRINLKAAARLIGRSDKFISNRL